MAKELELRLAVGHLTGLKSTTWRIFTRKNDVYAAHRSMAGIEKISFHQSRICRRAFIAEHRLPNQMADRVLQKWIRAETPPAGDGKVVAVLSIIFPTAHLSDSIVTTSKAVTWISPAPPAYSRVVQLIFSSDSETVLSETLARSGERNELIAYHRLPSGEAFAIIALTSPWEGRTLIIQPAEGQTEDIVLPSFATPTVARPVMFTTFTQPHEMRCFEFTGFRMPAGQAALLFKDTDFLTNRQIIDKGRHTGRSSAR